jgi:multidrug efflux pump subunit AcrA (membrane-fusion protein)
MLKMTRRLTFSAIWGTLVLSGTLSAQTPPRMALPTGGLTPPAMTPTPSVLSPPAKTAAAPVAPTNGSPAVLPLNKPATASVPPISAAATPAPAKPVFVAAQPTFAPINQPSEVKPAATPAALTPALAAPATAAPTVAASAPTTFAVPGPAPAVTAPTPASSPLPEWRYKPVQPPTSSTSTITRYDRTALQQPESAALNRIRDCLLKASAEVQLPAQEAGVLVELQAFEGQEVKLNQPLGRIDDAQPRLQKKAAEAERDVTAEKGKSTVSERYALKASDVAKQEWQKAIESNDRAPNSVSQVEVMRLKLTYEKGILEHERAQEERRIENLTTAAKDVDVLAADDAIRRRHLISPIAGTIVELTPHVGEWLKPGDPVLKIVNMEILKIEGYVNIKAFRQDELKNRTVIAEVDMGTKTPLNVPAKITFVSPIVEPGGEYRIKVEIQNRKNPQSNEWILKPGLSAELVLDAAIGNP